MNETPKRWDFIYKQAPLFPAKHFDKGDIKSFCPEAVLTTYRDDALTPRCFNIKTSNVHVAK